MVFGTVVIQVEKLNDGKGLSESQQNHEKVHILRIEQPLSGFRVKRMGL